MLTGTPVVTDCSIRSITNQLQSTLCRWKPGSSQTNYSCSSQQMPTWDSTLEVCRLSPTWYSSQWYRRRVFDNKEFQIHLSVSMARNECSPSYAQYHMKFPWSPYCNNRHLGGFSILELTLLPTRILDFLVQLPLRFSLLLQKHLGDKAKLHTDGSPPAPLPFFLSRFLPTQAAN